MKGKFIRTPTGYIFCLFMLLAGSFIAIRFGSFGILALQEDQLSLAIFCFAFSGGGLLAGILSILIFRFNKNAFLTIENNRIDARFSWGEELHTDIGNISNAELHGKHMKLLVGNQLVWIYNLHNAKEICQYILSQITQTDVIPNLDEAEKTYRKNKKSYILYLSATIAFVALMFFHIAWCVLLTEGKELTEFAASDDLIFLAFAFAELFTVLIAFLLASKCGKKLEAFHLSKRQILSALALEHKYDALDVYPNVIDKKYFDRYTYRIVVYSPKESVFAYMLEQFDLETLSWKYCYEQARGFERLSELYEDLDDSFADVILED